MCLSRYIILDYTWEKCKFKYMMMLQINHNLNTQTCVYLFAYRLLEADSKSMRSMSGSRRNSGSSLVSSSSASSNLSHLEEDTWILWGRIVNEWDEWRRKKDKLLKVMERGRFFGLFCGHPFSCSYPSFEDFNVVFIWIIGVILKYVLLNML